MHAALITEFGQPPRYETADSPEPADGELLVDVLAAGLHPRVRSGAAGSHYAGSTELPLVPGVDGVGRVPGGQRGYFLALDSRHGTMAELTTVRPAFWFGLPDAADENAVAAGVNPAMSSWVPLRRRVPLQAGQRVLILGATGSAGRAAVQIARLLGAGWIAGAGRNAARLSELTALGADATIELTGSDSEIAAAVRDNAADTDIVIDYLWGTPARAILPAVLMARSDDGRPITWLHIGAVGGDSLELPSGALRAHNLTITGSGQGSLSRADFAAELPQLIAELCAGRIAVDAMPVPLREVESTWDAPVSHQHRVVFRP
jgi:NADPH:quinone reductase-like Zn-dependent oxidoreductase